MWLLLQKHKSVLQMHQRKIYDEECLKIDNSENYTLNNQLFESISKSLNEAETKEEIDDVDAKFSLHFLSPEEKMDGKFKRPIRKSLYSNCMMAGLWKLASQFRYASEQLSLQIALEKMVSALFYFFVVPAYLYSSKYKCKCIKLFSSPSNIAANA